LVRQEWRSVWLTYVIRHLTNNMASLAFHINGAANLFSKEKASAGMLAAPPINGMNA